MCKNNENRLHKVVATETIETILTSFFEGTEILLDDILRNIGVLEERVPGEADATTPSFIHALQKEFRGLGLTHVYLLGKETVEYDPHSANVVALCAGAQAYLGIIDADFVCVPIVEQGEVC